eukprot:1343875-Prymnesium_polylepis.1
MPVPLNGPGGPVRPQGRRNDSPLLSARLAVMQDHQTLQTLLLAGLPPGAMASGRCFGGESIPRCMPVHLNGRGGPARPQRRRNRSPFPSVRLAVMQLHQTLQMLILAGCIPLPVRARAAGLPRAGRCVGAQLFHAHDARRQRRRSVPLSRELLPRHFRLAFRLRVRVRLHLHHRQLPVRLHHRQLPVRLRHRQLPVHHLQSSFHLLQAPHQPLWKLQHLLLHRRLILRRSATHLARRRSSPASHRPVTRRVRRRLERRFDVDLDVRRWSQKLAAQPVTAAPTGNRAHDAGNILYAHAAAGAQEGGGSAVRRARSSGHGRAHARKGSTGADGRDAARGVARKRSSTIANVEYVTRTQPDAASPPPSPSLPPPLPLLPRPPRLLLLPPLPPLPRPPPPR